MKTDSVTSRNRTTMLIGALIFMVVNTIIVISVCNTQFISESDKFIWNTKIILIISGICFGGLFLVLRFLKSLTIKKLFLIFLIVRVIFLFYFVVFNYYVETIDFAFYSQFPPHVLSGGIFTPYLEYWRNDVWRTYPPMFIWWYTYNYWVYGLDVILWRFMNLLLEMGIIYVMIQIFQENSVTEKGWNVENFKIGLSIYIFSFIPIVIILLYGNMIAFPVLISLLGFLYFFRSKKNPKYLYYAVFFFGLAALTEFFAAFWILVILLINLFQKNFKRFFILIGEFMAIFCLVTLPFLINDALGYLPRLSYVVLNIASGNWDGTIWAIDSRTLNVSPSINYVPAIIAIILSLYYIYKNYKFEISLDLFIVIISIFLFLSPEFSAWHYLWIFSLISLNIIYSFRKFLITNLFFWGYFFFFIIWFVLAYLTYPGIIFSNFWETYIEIFHGYMPSAGYFIVLPLIIQTIFQMGFIYLIFSYTKSKTLVSALLMLFIIYYIFNICMPANLMFY